MMRRLALSLAPLTALIAPVASAAPERWAHEVAGRPAHPDATFGTLPNGMRYAVMPNATPRDTISVRLVLSAGSMDEAPDARGAAHFLEHIAFRSGGGGSDGELVRQLERLGMRLGPDTNALTGLDRTLYQFDLPRNDPAALASVLSLLRAIVGDLRIDPAIVERERGVILAEERATANPSRLAAQTAFDIVMAGSNAAGRAPIGTRASVGTMTADQLRAFYDAHYRPARATLIVVGAVAREPTVRAITERFADWRARGADPVRTVTPPVIAAKERVVVAPGAVEGIEMTWLTPADPRPDTLDRDRDDVARLLALTTLTMRLTAIAQRPSAPFTSVRAIPTPPVAGVRGVSIVARPAPGRWQDTVTTILAEQRRLLKDPITPAEAMRATNALRTSVRTSAERLLTTPNAVIASSLVVMAQRGDIFNSGEQAIAAIEAIIPQLDARALTGAARLMLGGPGPVVVRTTPAAVDGDEAALARVMRDARVAPVPPPVLIARTAWPHGDFGAAGAIVSRTRDPATGATTVTFANGTRAIVAPGGTKGEVAVRVAVGSGRLGIDPARASSLWLVDSPAFVLGGTTRGTMAQLRQGLSETVVSLNTTFATDAVRLAGDTRPADLGRQLEYLAAMVAEPGFRTEAVLQLRTGVEGAIAQQASPGIPLSEAARKVQFRDDPRWGPLTLDNVRRTQPEDLPILLRTQLAGPVDVAIAGDVDVDAAIAQVARTFGAIGGRDGARPARPTQSFAWTPPATPITVRHKGRADQGMIETSWPLADYWSAPADAVALDVAAAIINGRMTETLRAKMGLTYATSTRASNDLDLPGFGVFAVRSELPPTAFPTFRAELGRVVATLATTPPDADEVSRARDPLVAAWMRAQERAGNRALDHLRSLRDPRHAGRAAQVLATMKAVAPADIMRVVRRYLHERPALTVQSQAATP